MNASPAVCRPARVRWLVRGLAVCTVLGALSLLTGWPQHLYHVIYDALAYPPVALGQLAHSAAHPGARAAAAPDWDGWMADPEATYARLMQPAYQSLQGVILFEVALGAVLPAVAGWRATWFVVTRPGRVQPGAPHGTARWMNEREMQQLAYKAGCLLLGQAGRWTLALDRQLQTMNVLLIGPPGSGKSSSVIIGNLLREPGTRSIVVTDLKNELLQTCYRALERRHAVWVVNFLSPGTSLGYNPLEYCVDELSTALFCNAWIENTGRSQKEPFWDNACRELMMAGIAHLKATDPHATLAHLDDFLCNQTPGRVIAALKQSDAPLARKKAWSFMAALEKNDKLLGSVFSEITPRLMILSDPRVRATTSRNEVDFRRLADPHGKPVALFLSLDRTLQEEMKPLLAAFFLDLFRTLSTQADAAPGGRLARDVFVYGDEFGNLGAVPKMPIWISTLRSAGVGMLIALQTTAQAKATYGQEGFKTIQASCATKIGLSNMVDDDAKWFSELSGQATVVATSASQQRGRFHLISKSGSRSEQETSRALLTVDEVRRLPKTEMLVLVGELPPARVTQRRWYQDDAVKHLVERSVSALGPARPDPLSEPALPARPRADDEALDGQSERDHDAMDPAEESVDSAGAMADGNDIFAGVGTALGPGVRPGDGAGRRGALSLGIPEIETLGAGDVAGGHVDVADIMRD